MQHKCRKKIRTVETKLVKMFSELLITKSKLAKNLSKALAPTGSELKQWLKVVGLSDTILDAVWQRVSTLELLLDKSNAELRQLIESSPGIDENEVLRWQRAMFNLKRCHQSMITNKHMPEQTDLSWTYWNGVINQMPENGAKSSENDANQAPPLTPRTSHHLSTPLIPHRFTKKFRALSTCDFCNKQMFFGLKCIECKYSCHKDCEASVPPTCGVPPELMSEFKQTFNLDSPNHVPLPSPDIIEAGNGFYFSSSRSSSKKSPLAAAEASNSSISYRRSSSTLAILKNYFEELSYTTEQKKDAPEQAEESAVDNPIPKMLSRKSSETVSLNESIALSIDSVRSDSTEDRQSEWGIQFDDIQMGEVIGRGRFGVVKMAQWHGVVAVKLLNPNYLGDAQSLDAFKAQIATFKNTRHDNLILFMGFCMEPQAIITSLCKGSTLYTCIHLMHEKFNLNKAADIAQQISNGMSYLHAKDSLHKDLTTKNIFLEKNARIIITDFGLFSATKLRCSNGLYIPNNWLCYLAPELIRKIKQTKKNAHDELPFSKASDVYAFGTVWYEILSGEFPFKGHSPYSVIFQVGIGMKQTLANLQATREVKDVLMFSWAYQADDRPEFNKLLQLLKEFPKKQMPRASARRAFLSLSAESVF